MARLSEHGLAKAARKHKRGYIATQYFTIACEVLKQSMVACMERTHLRLRTSQAGRVGKICPWMQWVDATLDAA